MSSDPNIIESKKGLLIVYWVATHVHLFMVISRPTLMTINGMASPSYLILSFTQHLLGNL